MNVSFEDFDPNNPDHISPWLVYSGGTSFKLYGSRGPALNGLMSWSKGKLYENVGGRWELRALKDAGARGDCCDVCHKPGVKDSYGPRIWSSRPWAWKRLSGARSAITDPLVLLYICYPCRLALGL